MEDVPPSNEHGDAAPRRSPPPPPEPNADAGSAPIDPTHNEKSDELLRLENEEWDITSISALAAVQMLIQALVPLAEATGDIPPTPPVSRPITPLPVDDDGDPMLRTLSGSSSIPRTEIGSPEAHPEEPISVVGADAEDVALQHAAIARRFFSKTPPHFSLSEYLLRLHQYCPHSPGVYLAAAAYCHRLCVEELMVPATNRTVHRLALAAIRISAKALEDNKWTQDRMSKVGGVGKIQLMNLEVALCFLLDFDLWVDDKVLARRMFLLQQASRHDLAVRGKLNANFKLKLPARRRKIQAKTQSLAESC